MSKTREEYIELYYAQIKESERRLNEIDLQRTKDKEDGKIPNHLLDSEETKQKKIINTNKQLLSAMGIDYEN